MRRVKVLYYDPGSNTALDVTSRCRNIGKITRGTTDPNKILSFNAGDVDVEFSVRDGWANGRFGPGKVTDLTKYPQVEILRQNPATLAWSRRFRGFLEPQNARISQRRGILAGTVLGPRRAYLDVFDADSKMRRTFQPMAVLVDAAEGATTVSISPSNSTNLVPGDRVIFSPPGSVTDGGEEHTLAGVVQDVEAAATQLQLSAPLEAALPIGTVVTCSTPYYRNLDIVQAATLLFDRAGIGMKDVRVSGSLFASATGLILQTFNTQNGLPGRICGLTSDRKDQGGGDSLAHIFASIRPGSPIGDPTIVAAADRLGLNAAQNISDGFTPVGEANYGRVTGDNLNGGFFDPIDHAYRRTGGTYVDPQNIEMAYGQPYIQRRRNRVLSVGTGDLNQNPNGTPDFRSDVTRDAWTMAGLHTLATPFAFRQVYKERVRCDVNDDAVLNNVSGGGEYTVSLERYSSSNFGRKWLLDSLGFGPDLMGSITATAGAAVYQYQVEAIFNLDDQTTNGGTGRLGYKLTGNISGPATLSPGNKIVVRWSGVAGATRYRVWRKAISGSTHATCMIGVTNATTFQFDDIGTNPPATIFDPPTGAYDGGQLVSLGLEPSGDGYSASATAPTNRFRLAWGTNYGGPSGVHYNHSLESARGVQPSTLYTTVWSGGGNANRCLRIVLDQDTMDQPVAIQNIAYSCGGIRILATEQSGNTAEIFIRDTNLVSIQHRRLNSGDGPFVVPASIANLPTGGFTPLLSTMHWNRDTDTPTAASGRRVSLFYYKDTTLLYGQLSIDAGDAANDMRLRESIVVTPSFGGALFYSGEQVDGANSDVDADPIFANWWEVTVGSSTKVWTQVFHIATGATWGLIAKSNLGFLSYFDCSGLDGTGVFEELSIVANARLEVDWYGSDASTVPYGRFLSRDLIPVIGAVNVDFSVLSGGKFRNHACVKEVVSQGMWTNNFANVKVTWAGGTVQRSAFTNPDGSADQRDRTQGLSIKSRFIESESLAIAIAEGTLNFFAPRDENGNVLPPRGAHRFVILDDWQRDYIPQSELTIVDEDGNAVDCWVAQIEEDVLSYDTTFKLVEAS